MSAPPPPAPPAPENGVSDGSTTTVAGTAPDSTVTAAETCRWDGLHFPKCTFKTDEMESWLDSVRAQMYTRKASFLLNRRLAGDDNLQTMCLLALKASLPASKRPLFSCYVCFTDAFTALEKQCTSARQAAALSKQAELTNLTMRSSETLVTYLDRVSALWGSLHGSAQAIDEQNAVLHCLRGLNPAHSWFLALATASSITTFVSLSQLATQHASSHVVNDSEAQQFARDTRPGGGRGRRGRGYRGNRPLCSKCRRHHYESEKCHTHRPPASGNGQGCGAVNHREQFHHSIGHVEFCNAEAQFSSGVTLSLCVDSGATNVITPDKSVLSDYRALPASAGRLKLVTNDTHCDAVGYGTLTLRSRTTGHTLSFSDVLHVPSARRTLICIGKALRAGVFWHFTSPTGGYVTVDQRGYWGDMYLSSNDLLFLDAAIVQPTSRSHSTCRTPPDIQNAEISNADLTHRRHGHPGRKVIQWLVSKGYLPRDATHPLTDACLTCATCKIHSVPRAPLVNPASRPLQRMHADLIVLSTEGLNGERYALVLTDQYSGYMDASPLKRKSDAIPAIQERILFYERQLQPHLVTTIMSDQGGEFSSHAFSKWCRARGIQQLFSPAHTSRSNGRAENSNLHLETLTRVLMADTSMSADLWPEVMRHGAAYLLNRRPRRIQGRMLIPFTAFTGLKVSYDHLRIIGSPCVVLHKPTPRHKFAPRGTADAILLGYVSNGRNSTCMYRVWMPAQGRAISVVDVQVLEPSHLQTPQEPHTRDSPGAAIPAEHSVMARESAPNHSVLVPSPTPPAPPVFASDRSGGLGSGGGQGPSISGVPPPSAPPSPDATVGTEPPPACVSQPDQNLTVDTSGVSHGAAGTSNPANPESPPAAAPAARSPSLPPLPLLTPIAAEEPSSPTFGPPPSLVVPGAPVATVSAPPSPSRAAAPGLPASPLQGVAPGARRSLRVNLGVPPARFDGSASAAERLASQLWPDTSAGNPPARDYLLEVQAAEGDHEDLFDASRTSLALRYFEVLTASAAPAWQRDAPRTLAQALARPDADLWRAAMLEELTSLRANHVWELAHLPPGHVPIGLRWVLSYKLRPDGGIERYKARLVAKGYTQQHGVDFFEVWAPTGRLAAYRMLLSHAAAHDLPVQLLDFKTAFLNGPLHEEIYVSQPPGFSDGTPQVWRLRRALYGLKQAANAWHSALASTLGALGYTASQVDPAVFMRRCSDGIIILHTHVDDCAAAGPADAVKSDFSALLSRYEGRELGEIDNQVFLGLYHQRNWDKHLIYVSQPKHVENLLSQYGFSDSKPVSSPLDHKVVLSATTDNDKAEHPQLSCYAAIVGSLMYLASCSRPDVCFSASMLARFMSKPSDQHLHQAHRVLRYLAKTRSYRLALGGTPDRSEPLEVWSDSDHAGCVATRRSVAGHAVCVHGSVVHWRSVRQSTVAKSTMIAEYYAASHAADEAMYFRCLLSEMGYTLAATPLYCDNASAVTILDKPVVNDKSRYAAVNAHYVRERVALDEIKIVSASTDDMLADCMTKALSPDKHIAACKLLAVAKGESTA